MKITIYLFMILVCSLLSEASLARGRQGQSPTEITNFNQAKKFLFQHLDLYDNKTIYCSCSINKKSVDLNSCGYKVQSKKRTERAFKIEFEHVVPAEAFGKSFAEWRTGGQMCRHNGKSFKGRNCAKTNAEFARMESDLYNLFPEIGELNGLRSNYSMAALTESSRDFGNCKVKISDRKFEPQESSKGIVARTYFNFDNRYPGRGIVSDKNRKLFEAWDKQHPVTELECRRWKNFERINRYAHLSASRCLKLE